MSNNIERYTLEDKDGNDITPGGESYDDYDIAIEAASVNNARLIINEYEWADSYMEKDFTGSEEADDDEGS